MAAAAVLQPNNVVNINHQNYGVIENRNASRSGLDHVIEYLKTGNGDFRFLQLLQRVAIAVAMVLVEMGNTLASFFEDLSGKLGIAWGMLTLPRLPDVTKKAWEAITTWGTVEGPEGYPMRSHVERVHDLAECSASWGYAASMVLNNSQLKNMADIPNFISDVTDMTMAAENISIVGKHLEQIPADQTALRERFAGTQEEAYLRLTKAVASVASGAFTLLALAFGGPFLPAAALLAISITSTIFAMAAHFFKETRTYEVVKFFEWRKPEVEVPVGDIQVRIN